MAKILVLGGAGAMGQISVHDLANTCQDAEIVIGDINLAKAEEIKGSLKKGNLSAAKVDISNDESLEKALTGIDCVLNATPYYFNLNVMKAALKTGTQYVDLGGLYHETVKQLKLDKDFREKGLLAILGMGSCPGTTNVMTEAVARDLDTVEDVIIYCAGYEEAPLDHPFFPPYMLDTILDEYTLDAVVFENGEFKNVPPLSKEESVDFDKPIGKQSVIPTIHSELATIPDTYKERGIKNCAFKLALDPEFHRKAKFLVDLSFGGKKDVELEGKTFAPRKVLLKMIQNIPVEDDRVDDMEVLRVDVKGKKGGEEKLVRAEVLAVTDQKTQIGGADLNTGVPPSVVSQMIIGNQMLKTEGVLPPETCVDPDKYFAELKKRGMTYSVKTIAPEAQKLSV